MNGEFGFKAKTNLEEGLERTIKWHREKNKGCSGAMNKKQLFSVVARSTCALQRVA